MKILSNILLILNPIFGFSLFCIFFTKYWFIFPIFIILIILNLKFHFYTHKDEIKKYEEWEKEFSKTHEYLGLTPYYEDQVWRNKETGKIIEI